MVAFPGISSASPSSTRSYGASSNPSCPPMMSGVWAVNCPGPARDVRQHRGVVPLRGRSALEISASVRIHYLGFAVRVDLVCRSRASLIERNAIFALNYRFRSPADQSDSGISALCGLNMIDGSISQGTIRFRRICATGGHISGLDFQR